MWKMNIEKDNQIEIVKVEQGYIVKSYVWKDDNPDGSKRYVETIHLINDNDDEKETLKNLLLLVAELEGYFYNKFGSNNLKISFDMKGSKVE